jgi:formate dehydrogenase iron-sulfur subunit
MSMLVDTSICIGCKGCEVACKQWNELPAEIRGFSGQSYDNTVALSDKTWCHVGFREQGEDYTKDFRWLFVSDRCKHCGEAGCLEVCPTGAIYRTETGAVNINTGVCNGCQNCVSACPFGVVSFNHDTGVVGKCTLCSDRTEILNREPACVTACPTDALVWGEREEMLSLAEQKRTRLLSRGGRGQVYGKDELGGLNVFFLLQDEPEVYGLPSAPEIPSNHVPQGYAFTAAGSLLLGLAAVVSFRNRRVGAEDRVSSPEKEA